MPDPCQGLGVLGAEAVVSYPAVFGGLREQTESLQFPVGLPGLDLEEDVSAFFFLPLKRFTFDPS